VFLLVRVELSGNHLLLGCWSFALRTFVENLKELFESFLANVLGRLYLGGLWWSESGLHLVATLADVTAPSEHFGLG